MENQHRQITGYRELSQEEIDLMNEIKAKGIEFEALIAKTREHVMRQTRAARSMTMAPIDADPREEQRILRAQPERWVNIAATELQQGLMALTRAVAQPASF